MALGHSVVLDEKRQTRLLAALARCRAAGRTPLLLDENPDRPVDTFFKYRSAVIVSGKAMVIDERLGRRGRDQLAGRFGWFPM